MSARQARQKGWEEHHPQGQAAEYMDSTPGGLRSIKAQVPMAETFRYATDLRSMTGGRGTFTAKLLGYEECPSHIAQKVIADHEAQQAEEPAAAR